MEPFSGQENPENVEFKASNQQEKPKEVVSEDDSYDQLIEEEIEEEEASGALVLDLSEGEVESNIPEEYLITVDKLKILVDKIQKDKDDGARENLVHLFHRYSLFLVNKYFPEANDEDKEDLAQEARLGLLKAAEKCDPYRIDTFKAYAGKYIWGYMMRWYMKENKNFIPSYMQDRISKLNKVSGHLDMLGEEVSDEELSELLEVSEKQLFAIRRAKNLSHVLSLDKLQLEDADDEENAPDERWTTLNEKIAGKNEEDQPESAVEEVYWQNNIEKLLDCLTPKELFVVEKKYGEELTWMEISHLLGLNTAEGSRRYGAKALKKMRQQSRLLFARGNFDKTDTEKLYSNLAEGSTEQERRYKDIKRNEIIEETGKAQEFINSFSEDLKKSGIVFDIFQPGFWKKLTNQFKDFYENKPGYYKHTRDFTKRGDIFANKLNLEIIKNDLLQNVLLKKKLASSEDANIILGSLPEYLDLMYSDDNNFVFNVEDFFLFNDMRSIESCRKQAVARTEDMDTLKHELTKRLELFDRALSFSHTTFSDPEAAEIFGGPFSDDVKTSVNEYFDYAKLYPWGQGELWRTHNKWVLDRIINNYDQENFGLKKK